MELVFAGLFGAAQGVRDLQWVEGPTGSFLCVLDGSGGGIASYGLTEGAGVIDETSVAGGSLYRGGLRLLSLNDVRWLLTDGTTGGELQAQEILSDGTLADMRSWSLPDGGGQNGLRALTATVTGAEVPVVYGIDAATGMLVGWQLRPGGGVDRSVNALGPDTAYQLPVSALLAVAETGSGQVLLVADSDTGGLRSYQIGADTGDLVAAEDLDAAQGLSLATPSVLEVATAYGQTWALLGAAGSNGLSLIAVEGDGGLRVQDHVMDTGHSRFGAISAVKLVQVGDHVLVLAAGGDDGLTVMRLLPEGRLIHLVSLPHAAGLGLSNVTALECVVTATELQIVAGSETGVGLSRFTLALADLGVVETAEAGDRLRGTARDDLLIGAGGATLEGGAGDDTLVQGGIADWLSGGAGADHFVLKPLSGRVTVMDFTPGQDQLDLSLFPGLRSLAQLTFVARADGLLLRFDETEIRVLSARGEPLTLQDLWPQGFEFADRLLPGQFEEDGVTYGSGAGDQLAGGGAGDQIQGFGGDDRLQGYGGADRLQGGDGQDQLWGGTGRDTLAGDAGNDSLWGGGGADQLAGGWGADRLYGNAGADDLSGGAGDDRLKGHDGDDSLTGGSGEDRLYGGKGDDRLQGGDGADRLMGGRGADTLLGGTGQDTLFGGGKADHLLGGRGADRLEGGAGQDLLKGRGGADVLSGDAGRDQLWGNVGADTLKGGGGGDRLKGNAGADVLHGGRGGDQLWGGGGADVFAFANRHGTDRIKDFRPGRDQIDLQALGRRGAADFADLEITRQDGDLRIVTGEGVIWLENLRLSQISADDFLF